MSNPCDRQSTMITASISRLNANTGIVILVGIAARFTTTHMVIAANAKGQKIKLLPVSRIVAMVIIVTTHPCPAMANAVHSRRFFSWPSAH